MKISQPPDNAIALSSNTLANATKSGAAANALPKATVTKGAQSAGVAVTVSPLARSMEVAEGAAASDVDTAKVNAIRTAISQGTYVVNPEAIADKLLSNAQEMLTRNRA